MTLQQTISERLKELDPSYGSYILSAKFEDLCGLFSNAHNLDDERDLHFQNALLMLLTLIIDRQGFGELLKRKCGLTSDESALLIEGFLQAIPAEVAIYDHAAETQISDQSETTSSLADEISETERLLRSVPPIRTMYQDSVPGGHPLAEDERVYTSTQSAILNEGREASSNQTVSQGDTKPRWDSER